MTNQIIERYQSKTTVIMEKKSKTLVIIVFILCIISQLSTSAKKRQNMVLKNCGNVYEIVDTFFFNRLDSIVYTLDFSKEIPHKYYFISFYKYNKYLIEDSIYEKIAAPDYNQYSPYERSAKYNTFLEELPDSSKILLNVKYIITLNVEDDILLSEIMAKSQYIYQFGNYTGILINLDKPLESICEHKIIKSEMWEPTKYVLIYENGQIYLYDTYVVLRSRFLDAPKTKKTNKRKNVRVRGK